MNVPKIGHSPFPVMPDLIICTADVEKQLLSINLTKVCRPDEPPSRLLKTVACELAPAMTFLFSQSYINGIVPKQWNQAIVTGIFKKGSK